MSATAETSLTSMKAAFPAAPDPIQGIPMLASLIDLMLHTCRCLQTQKTPASATMNMLFCAASPGLYSFFMTEAYPSTYFPFPNEVDAVPDFSTCTSDNEREMLKATNARDRKTRADVVTMKAALSDVFFPRESTQSNSRDVRANLHETTKHGISTHVRLVHHEVWQNNDRRSRRFIHKGWARERSHVYCNFISKDYNLKISNLCCTS
jgi:hypothetical protein